MLARRQLPGSMLHSVALRYQPRTFAPWSSAPRRGLATSSDQAPLDTDAATGNCRRDHPAALVEAALFLSNEPLSGRKLCQLAGLADPTQARTLVRKLNEFYQRQQSAFRVEEVAGGYQLLSDPCFGGWLRRLHDAVSDVRLSTPAIETLSVVAYRQPVVRAEIESIRGVQCGEMLRQLIEGDLVRIVGRSAELGRPFLYGTTRRFLQVFGLRDLDDLPRAELLRKTPGPDEGAPIEARLTDGGQLAIEPSDIANH